MQVEPVILDGAHVRLEPLSLDPPAAFPAAGLDPELRLRHAVETPGCIRVEFKTDARDERSRAAAPRDGDARRDEEPRRGSWNHTPVAQRRVAEE